MGEVVGLQQGAVGAMRVTSVSQPQGLILDVIGTCLISRGPVAQHTGMTTAWRPHPSATPPPSPHTHTTTTPRSNTDFPGADLYRGCAHIRLYFMKMYNYIRGMTLNAHLDESYPHFTLLDHLNAPFLFLRLFEASLQPRLISVPFMVSCNLL